MKNAIDRHLCFVCANAYPLFTAADSSNVGGVETRSVMLAELMSKYFSVVTFAIKKIDGLEVINNRGLNVFLYEPAVISNTPNRGLAKIDADIYVVFESHYFSADVVRTCNIIGKKVVHWATSFVDYSNDARLENDDCIYLDWIGRESGYCIYFADYLISQTEDQRKALREYHGLNSTIIRNPVRLPLSISKKKGRNGKSFQVLWIGRADPIFKRPMLLLEIAGRMPTIKFLMVMNRSDIQHYEDIVTLKTDNIEIIESVAYDKISSIYSSCELYLSTSSKEGFPNVFLEAIKYGLPIVSLEVDPDELFSKHGCGIVCNGNIEYVVKAINQLLSDQNERKEITERAFLYVQKNHSSEVIENQMIEFFSNIKIEPEKSFKWADYSYDRAYQELREAHHKLINHLVIRIWNKILKVLGKDPFK